MIRQLDDQKVEQTEARDFPQIPLTHLSLNLSLHSFAYDQHSP